MDCEAPAGRRSEIAPILRVENLTVNLHTRRGPARALRSIDLDVAAGAGVAVVGESGSGKSMLASAILRLLPVEGGIEGRVTFEGQDLLTMDAAQLRKLRGNAIAVVPQDAASSLDPLMPVDAQVREVVVVHGRRSAAAAGLRDAMAAAGLDPETAGRYPHQMSGGMRQRAVLTMAFANSPRLLIADEPTSALDPTLRAHFIERVRGRLGHLSLLLLTHDMDLAAALCSRVAVLYAGEIVEEGTATLFETPLHPYTTLLISGSRYEGATAPEPAPDLFERPNGCAFHPRCPERRPQCSTDSPGLVRKDGHAVRCWLHE